MWQARVQACLLKFVRGVSVLINGLGESRSRGSASKDSVCVQVTFGGESGRPRRLITTDVYIYAYTYSMGVFRFGSGSLLCYSMCRCDWRGALPHARGNMIGHLRDSVSVPSTHSAVLCAAWCCELCAESVYFKLS